MKIYLASSWRNTYQQSVLAELRAAGHEVYDFKNPGPGETGFSWKQITPDPIADGNALRQVLAHPIAQHGFDLDFDAMKWADACVLLLPCGNSAHLEAGWFSGQGKPVAVLVPELREPELMYKCFDTRQRFGKPEGPSVAIGNWETPIFTTTDEVHRHLEAL